MTRARPAVAAQPVRQPPSVNSQDARTGQAGYITQGTSSGTKTNTQLLDVLQPISVLTKEQSKNQGFTSIGEATRYIHGVIYH